MKGPQITSRGVLCREDSAGDFLSVETHVAGMKGHHCGFDLLLQIAVYEASRFKESSG